jgi:hypothetical protein
VGCGIVEGTVSTSGVPLPIGVGLGVALGGLFWTAIVVRGRPARPGEDLPSEPMVEPVRPRPVTAPIATSP